MPVLLCAFLCCPLLCQSWALCIIHSGQSPESRQIKLTYYFTASKRYATQSPKVISTHQKAKGCSSLGSEPWECSSLDPWTVHFRISYVFWCVLQSSLYMCMQSGSGQPRSIRSLDRAHLPRLVLLTTHFSYASTLKLSRFLQQLNCFSLS